MRYPVTRTSDVLDDYHGTLVQDPYRWLEDVTDPEVKAWVEAQNALTRAFLDAIPERVRIRTRLRDIVNYPRLGSVLARGGVRFSMHNAGLQDQPVLRVEAPGQAPRELIDPNELSEDGTIALANWSPSRNGKLLAYALSRGGSDWMEWRVRDVATGHDLPDVIQWSKFSSASWSVDDAGFFYGAYDAPEQTKTFHQDRNTGQKLYYHLLGTSQAQDELVYDRPEDPDWFLGCTVSDDGQWLIVSLRDRLSTNNRVYVRDLSVPGSKVEPLFDANDAQYAILGNDGNVFYATTTRGAPRERIVRFRRDTPDHWTEVVPQAPEAIQSAAVFGERLYVTYMQHAKSVLRVYTLDGSRLPDVELPGLGAIGPLLGERGDSEAYFAYTDFLTPPSVLVLDTGTGKTRAFFEPMVAFDREGYEAKQVFFTSKDGTCVPMFLVHKRGLELTGDNPTLLYGYGGFNIPLLPGFSAQNAIWLELGGVYAMPNLRGGGEYGQEWHDAGRKLNKQNVFDDFIAAAEWLIANDYTRPERLAIRGGSNGGLLVGAAMTQRPDLFAAALPAVGVMDMLRFNQFTIGYAWEADYGSPQNPDEFAALHAYSPLHNLRSGTAYPATLVTTADTDDRVVPAHSYKFAAALQAAHYGERPVLIRVETSAGHGAGNALSKTIEETADLWAFLVKALRIDVALSESVGA